MRSSTTNPFPPNVHDADLTAVPAIQTMKLPKSGKVTVEDCKEWNFDGSSTNQVSLPARFILAALRTILTDVVRDGDQAGGEDSDVYLRPAAVYKDPFRKGNNVLVLAECYNSDGTPNKTNFRCVAVSPRLRDLDSKY